MADLSNMKVFNRHNQIERLFLRFVWYFYLVNTASTDIGNYTDYLSVLAQTILDLSNLLDIHSVPGSEWELFQILRNQCKRIQDLLLVASIDHSLAFDECIEAIEQYCYLLMFENRHLAGFIERLCLGENTLGQREGYCRSAKEAAGRRKTPRRPAGSRAQRTGL